MINQDRLIRLMYILIAGTERDKIIWENKMLNIYETTWYDKKIITDWERDEPPMIIINNTTTHGYSVGIEELRDQINEQFKRLKKYKYSEAMQSSQTKIVARIKLEQEQNDKNFNSEIEELLASGDIIKKR